MQGNSGVYWAAIVAAFALLVVDIFSDGAIWNVLVIACIVIAMLARPGGFWGRSGTS